MQKLQRRWLSVWVLGVPLALGSASALAADAPATAAADGPSGPAINDDDPESSVPDRALMNRDPLGTGYMLMEMSVRAEKYYADKDWVMAAKYYRALAKAVPDRAIASAKLCEIYSNMGELEQALEACRKATSLAGVRLGDYFQYATLLMNRTPDGTPMPSADVSELDAVFAHLQTQNITGPEADVLQCRLAAKLEDVQRLRACVAQLEQKVPQDPVTFAYQFSLRLLERDFDQARGVVDRAREAQLPPEALLLMEQELETRERERLVQRLTRLLPIVLVPVILVAALVALWRRRRSTAAA